MLNKNGRIRPTILIKMNRHVGCLRLFVRRKKCTLFSFPQKRATPVLYEFDEYMLPISSLAISLLLHGVLGKSHSLHIGYANVCAAKLNDKIIQESC